MAIGEAGMLSWLEDFNNAFNYAFDPYLKKNDPFSRWLASQRPRMENQYGGATPTNLNMGPYNWLTGLTNPFDALGQSQQQTREFGQGVNPLAQWLALAPSQRGEESSRFAPQVTWRSLFGSR